MGMSENITITGATGVIGRRAVRELVAAGHRVTGVTRSPRGRAILSALGARPVDGDVYDERSLARAFAGADVVVNLLTHIPAAERMHLPEAWAQNQRLRTEASATIARAASAADARRLVQESVALLYADGGDRLLDEDAPLDPSGVVSASLVAERNAAAFAGDTVVLRFGIFIGPDSELTQADLARARMGLSPLAGAREAYAPTVWLDDAGSAVAAALRVPPGAYNVVDDDPPTRAEIDAALAAQVGTELVARAGDGGAMDRSLRVSNRRLRELGGWAPAVRGGTDGWRLVAGEPVAAA
jgi:UDP-glucose 4-epimerase